MSNGSIPSIFVVIPAYNEERCVGGVVARLKQEFSHVVVVDDGSTDQTAALSRQAGAEVLNHLINRGQGAALKTGIDYALARGADIIVTFDADGQHHAEDIAALVAPIMAQSFDVALGSRFLAGGCEVPRGRKIVLKCGVWFTRLVSRIRVTDTHNGLRALSRHSAQCIQIRQDGMAHASEILDEIARHRLRFSEVPMRVVYTQYSREKGQSSMAAFRIALDFLLGKWRN
jgi:glycosyltransferase involved in cell wall biosynthesis